MVPQERHSHGHIFWALLAEGHARGGRAEEGLSVVEQALAAVHETGERYYEAELYRLKGSLTLQSRAGLG